MIGFRACLFLPALLALQACSMVEPTGESQAPETAEWIGTALTLGGLLTAIAIFVLAWDFVREARKGNRQFRWAERFWRRRTERGQDRGQRTERTAREKSRKSP